MPLEDKTIEVRPEGSTSSESPTDKTIDAEASKINKILDWYCVWLDKHWVSPNQVVTYRIIAWLAAWVTLGATENLGSPAEILLWTILFLAFAHDHIDGRLARNTNQTSIKWEIFDAFGDKALVYPLIAIIVLQGDMNPYLFLSIIWITWVNFLFDLKSQLMRWGAQWNLDAIKSGLKKPLTAEEREANPNKKSSNAAVWAWQAKTFVTMGWILACYWQDIANFWPNITGAMLWVTLATAGILSLKSLRTKWVQWWDLLKPFKKTS